MDCTSSHANASPPDNASSSNRSDARENAFEETTMPDKVVLEVTLNVHRESITLESIRQAYSLSSQGTKTIISHSRMSWKRCKSSDTTGRTRKSRDHLNLEHNHHDNSQLYKSKSASAVVPLNRPDDVSGVGSEKQLGPPHLSLERSISKTEYALDCLRFINQATHDKDSQELWKDVEGRFCKLADGNGLLSRANFAYCIDMLESEEFALQLLDAYARHKGMKRQLSTLSIEALHEFWLQITEKSFHSRIQIFFDLCDKDADGRITEDEVKEVILLSASANKLYIATEQAEEYAALIMEELDQSGQGYIELSQLEALFRGGFHKEAQQNQGQLVQMTFGPPTKRWPDANSQWRKACSVLMTSWKRWWLIWLWLAFMSALFTWKFNQYKHRTAAHVMGYCLCTAKGAAETLKLNMGLILLPVCRNTITWLRSTILGHIMPFDDNLNFHKLIAIAIMFGVVLHGGVHMACDFPRIVRADEGLFSASMGSAFPHKPSYGDIMMTPEVLAGMVMVVLMSVAFVLAVGLFRRGAKLPWPLQRITGFNAFWYSHHLFIIVYLLLIYHSFNLFLAQHWSEKTVRSQTN